MVSQRGGDRENEEGKRRWDRPYLKYSRITLASFRTVTPQICTHFYVTLMNEGQCSQMLPSVLPPSVLSFIQSGRAEDKGELWKRGIS